MEPKLMWPTHFRSGDKVYRVLGIKAKQAHGLGLSGYALRFELTVEREPDPSPPADARTVEFPTAELDPISW